MAPPSGVLRRLLPRRPAGSWSQGVGGGGRPAQYVRRGGPARRAVASAVALAVGTAKVAGVAYAGALAMLYAFQRKIMYFPGDAAEVKTARDLRAAYGNAVDGVVDVFVPVRDGTGAVVHGYYMPPLPLAPSRTTLVMFHGNAGHVTHRVLLCAALRAATGGCGVAVMDYRGYGRSDPRYAPPSVAESARKNAARGALDAAATSLSERAIHADAEAFVEHLAQREKLNVARDVFLVGESLGTGVSVEMAARRKVRGLILFSAFSSIADVAVSAYGSLVPPPLLRLLLKDRFDSHSRATDTALPKHVADTPLLMFHGDADELVPMDLGLTLYRAWPCLSKAFVTIKGSGHNDLYDRSEELFRSVRNFVASHG